MRLLNLQQFWNLPRSGACTINDFEQIQLLILRIIEATWSKTDQFCDPFLVFKKWNIGSKFPSIIQTGEG